MTSSDIHWIVGGSVTISAFFGMAITSVVGSISHRREWEAYYRHLSAGDTAPTPGASAAEQAMVRMAGEAKRTNGEGGAS